MKKSSPKEPKKPAMTPGEQRRRFEETARELGCDQGETLDRMFGEIVPPKLPREKPE